MIGWMREKDVLTKLRHNGSVVAWTDTRHEPYPGHLFHYESYPVTNEQIAGYFEQRLARKDAQINNLVDCLKDACRTICVELCAIHGGENCKELEICTFMNKWRTAIKKAEGGVK